MNTSAASRKKSSVPWKRPVTALGNSQDYQLVAVNSGKCVDVSEVSSTPGALIHQWTCDAASALSTKKNQIWRLLGKA